MPDNRLTAAYRDTDYHVHADPPFVLRVGEGSPECDALLRLRGAETAAFLTAWNPMSEPRPRDRNDDAQARLRRRLERLRLDVLPGEGRARDGGWPPEDSVLAIGIGRAQAEGLAREFDQAAFVWIEAGKAADLVFPERRRLHGRALRREEETAAQTAPSENWLRRLIRTALDRDWCLDTRCTTCGGETFRRALRAEVAAALGRLPGDHLDPEGVLHVYAAAAALRPDPEEAARIGRAVRMVLDETARAADRPIDLTALIEGSWAWSTLYGMERIMAPGLGPQRAADPTPVLPPPPDPNLRGPIYSIYVATDGAAWDDASHARLVETVERRFKFWTVIEATGRFRGRDLPTRIVQIATKDEFGVKRLAGLLAAAFGQEAVGLVTGPTLVSVGPWVPPAPA